MAGSYPDVPGRRMAYDRDGSLVFYYWWNTVRELTPAQRTAINDEQQVGTFPENLDSRDHTYYGVLFPQLRDVVGYYVNLDSQRPHPAELTVSPDTTNGIDGTWTTLANPYVLHVGGPSGTATPTPTKPSYRTTITPLNAVSIRAIKFRVNSNIYSASLYNLHLYGNLLDDRLRIWHPTLDQEAPGAWFDWGNTPRDTTATRQFRIKNDSLVAANAVTVTREALTDASPSIVAQHDLSDGGVYATSLAIGDLSPGEVSAPLTVRRVLLPNSALGLWSLRIIATAGSWGGE